MFRSHIFLLSTILIVFFSFSELWLWSNVDKGENPLRYLRGDSAHYMSVLHAARLAGGPITNSYFLEQPIEPPQFVLFQSLVGFVSKIITIDTFWFALILKITVVLISFFVLSKIINLFGLTANHAYMVSFAFMFFYGPTSFQGYALGFWFLPFFLLALLLLSEFFVRVTTSWYESWRPALAMLLAAVHPIYFFMTGLAALILFVLKFGNEKGPGIKRIAILWAAVSCALFLTLFLPHLIIDWPAGTDTLYRIIAVDTRSPIHIFLGIKLLTLALLPFIIFGRNLFDRKWFIVFAFAIASFVGVESYLITGTYIANDHYGIIEDFLVIITLTLFLTNKTILTTRTKFLGLIILFIALLSIFIILDYLNFQLGYYGRWFPMHASYLTIALILIVPGFLEKIYSLLRYKKFLFAAAIGIPLLYGAALSYKDFQPNLHKHVEAQRYREIVEFLQKLPAGVVLAPPTASEIIHLATPHKIYWSLAAFSETATNEELFSRWRDMYLIFPKDESISGKNAVNSLVGTINRCTDFGRGRWIKMASELGMIGAEESFCGLIEKRKSEFLELRKEALSYAAEVDKKQLWQPTYRVDYLVLTKKDTEVPSWLISKYFVLEKDFGEVRIYRLK